MSRSAELRAHIDELKPLIASFQDLQRPDGSVQGQPEQALAYLDSILSVSRQIFEVIGRPADFDHLRADFESWRHSGVCARPDFQNVAMYIGSPENNTLYFLLGPIRCTNGVPPFGHRLEFALIRRDEPGSIDSTRDRFPHPKKNPCQAAHLIAGSAGFSQGNCIVLFPENILSSRKVSNQNFAIFFFNKFRRIFLEETIPAAVRVFGVSEDSLHSVNLSASEFYAARCTWGYLHDYFHHQGPRPLDENLYDKLNWYTGLLEEIKVDAQCALACLKQPGLIKFAQSVFEFILLDRLCRYPNQPDFLRNFDSGTGVFLWAVLMDSGVITRSGSAYKLHLEMAGEALEALVCGIERIETIRDSAEYRQKAKEFVFQYLSRPALEDKYAVPGGVMPALALINLNQPPILFDDDSALLSEMA